MSEKKYRKKISKYRWKKRGKKRKRKNMRNPMASFDWFSYQIQLTIYNSNPSKMKSRSKFRNEILINIFAFGSKWIFYSRKMIDKRNPDYPTIDRRSGRRNVNKTAKMTVKISHDGFYFPFLLFLFFFQPKWRSCTKEKKTRPSRILSFKPVI